MGDWGGSRWRRFSVKFSNPFKIALSAVVLASGVWVASGRADAAFRDHPSVVPGTPAKGYPIILNTPLIDLGAGLTARRQVYTANQAGRYIVSGGDFLQVLRADGVTVNRAYFAAWNIDTKALVCPQMTFDNHVLAVVEGPSPDKVYVAGRFTKITGADGVVRSRSRVALLDLSTCSVDPTFVPAIIDLKVDQLAYGAGRLFIGGDFTTIGGGAYDVLAELSPGTAAVKPALNLTFTGTYSTKIKAIAVSPDGTRLIFGGRFGMVANNGLSLDTETAVVNIADPLAPVLTPHSWRSPFSRTYQQDASVSPDGKWIATVYRGTPDLGVNVWLVSTAESAQTAKWSHAVGHDSVFGVGVSNNTVYLSGHFCRIAPGPGPTEVMSIVMGLNDCTEYPNGVWRGHIAALDINDGTPLAWNPGADSLIGGRELTVTTRGLLAGFDGERTNDIHVGALAFYDFGPGAEDVTPPGDVVFTAPAAGATVGNPARISGSATDNVGIASYVVAVQAANGQWIQPGGVLGATRYEFNAPAKLNGAFDLDVVMPGAGSYTAEAKAIDKGRNASPAITTRAFNVSNVDGVRPDSTIVVPSVGVPEETTATIIGSATDNVGVAAVRARITNSAGLFIQDDFSLSTAVNDLPVATGALGSTPVAWTLNAGSQMPAGGYTVEIVVTDTSNNLSLTKTASFTVVTGTTQIAAVTSYRGFTAKFGNYTMGSTFTVDTATSVTALGIFDGNGNGIFDNSDDTPAGLWRQSDQALLGSVTVPKTATPEGGWFYGPLATPVTLQPGVVYVVASLMSSTGEAYGTGGTVATDANYNFSGRAYLAGTALTYPSSQAVSVGYGVPNLKIGGGSSAPTVAITGPAATVPFGQSSTITGTAADNVMVKSVTVRVSDAGGQYLQANGIFAAAAADLMPATTGLGTPSTTFVYNAGALPAGSYTVAVTALDGVLHPTTATSTFAVIAGGGGGAHAAITAYTGYTAKLGNYTMGSTFTVDTATSVTALGIFDGNGNGVFNNAADTPAGLWRQSDQALLGTATVLRTAPSEGGWFYGLLPTPVTLQPGVVYVVASLVSSTGEPYGTGGTLTSVENYNFTGRAYLGGTALAYPSTLSTSVGYGIPNLKFGSGANPPAVLPVANQIGQVGVAIANVQVVATDPEGGVLSYSATGLPGGVTIDAATGVISGTPTGSGAFPATVTVTDPQALTATTSFTSTIAPAPQPPTIAAIAAQSSPTGTTVTSPTITGSDPEGGAAHVLGGRAPARLDDQLGYRRGHRYPGDDGREHRDRDGHRSAGAHRLGVVHLDDHGRHAGMLRRSRRRRKTGADLDRCCWPNNLCGAPRRSLPCHPRSGDHLHRHRRTGRQPGVRRALPPGRDHHRHRLPAHPDHRALSIVGERERARSPRPTRMRCMGSGMLGG